MSITDSLYRRSDFACALPHGCQLNVDLKVAGTRRVPSTLHFWVDGTRRVPTTLHTYEFILKCEKYTRKIKTE